MAGGDQVAQEHSLGMAYAENTGPGNAKPSWTWGRRACLWLRDSTWDRHLRAFICDKIETSPQHVKMLEVNGGVVVWLHSSRASQLTSGALCSRCVSR